MIKVTRLLILFFYIIPFLFISLTRKDFSIFPIIFIYFSFFVFSYLVERKNYIKIDYTNYLNSTFNQLIFFSLLFLIGRIELINELISVLFNGEILDFAKNKAVDRYLGFNENLSFSYQIGTIAFFCYCILLGCFNQNKKVYLYIILFLMILIESATLGRAGSVIGISLLLGEIIIRYNSSFSYIKIINNSIIILLISFILFSILQIARFDEGDELFSILILKFGEYTIGIYDAFYIWFNDYYNFHLEWGFNTFTPIFKILGFSVQQGFYELVNSNFGYTNIYTNMRGLISDFGIYLNVLLFSFFGIFICLKTYFRANVVEYFFLRLIIMLIIFPFYSIFSFTTSFSSVLISYMILTFYNK